MLRLVQCTRSCSLKPRFECLRAVGQLVKVDALSRPLLQPPRDGEGPVELNSDCGLDLDRSDIPTIAVIGPSRRGKSVLAGLLAGGNPGLFPQSHSSFQAMTSGTHVCEVLSRGSNGIPLRIIDTEGLSHIGRSRKNEALVRQFLISTYLSSSWVIWLDNDVLSSSFFNMMWLVHDYVVDVLRVKHAAGTRLPRLMYIRTQETDVQQREWRSEFDNFGSFFKAVLETHEDAAILKQMFNPDGIHGHSLPTWMPEDLDRFSANQFWDEEHASAFKDGIAKLCDVVLPRQSDMDDSGEMRDGPPLLSLSTIETYLPKISKLEAFDPRDHEFAKVLRARQHLRASYGKILETKRGSVDYVGLANLFEPEDKDVRESNYQLDVVSRARFVRKCRDMRVEPEIAETDSEVAEVLNHFNTVATIFSAGVDAFASDTEFSEKGIMHMAIQQMGLDANKLAAFLSERRARAEQQFLGATGVPVDEMRRLRLYELTVWKIDDCVQRLRRVAATQMELIIESSATGDNNGEVAVLTAPVWRLNEWQLSAPPSNGKTVRARRPKEYVLWTNGVDWAIYEEVKPGRGTLREKGSLDADAPRLPVPEVLEGAEIDNHNYNKNEATVAHMV